MNIVPIQLFHPERVMLETCFASLSSKECEGSEYWICKTCVCKVISKNIRFGRAEIGHFMILYDFPSPIFRLMHRSINQHSSCRETKQTF